MVREAIASVVGQRCVDFELIVVDDGSTDGTWNDLVDIAADQGKCGRLRILRTDHRGPASARNRGVAEASAPLIAFLDSDDLWAPLKLSRQISFMRANPEYAVAQTEEIWMRGGKRVNPGLRHRKRNGDFFVESLSTCLVSPSAAIMQREVFNSAGGFDEDMEAAEDYDLWLRILLRHRIGLMSEPLVTRRAGHPDQLSATIPALDRFRILALAKLLASANLTEERTQVVCGVLAAKCRIYGNGLAKRGRAEAGFYLEMAERAAIWQTGECAGLQPSVEAIRRTLARDRRRLPHGIH